MTFQNIKYSMIFLFHRIFIIVISFVNLKVLNVKFFTFSERMIFSRILCENSQIREHSLGERKSLFVDIIMTYKLKWIHSVNVKVYLMSN